MSYQPTSISFFFPYLEDSGVPVLFYRLANTIASNFPKTYVYVIDYENGAMARHLLNIQNLELIKFEKGVTVNIPQDTILVMQSFVPYYWPRELQPERNTKLFFWNLHTRNFVPSLLPFPGIRDLPKRYFPLYRFLSFFYFSLLNRIKKYVNLLITHDAVAFMDRSTYQSVCKYIFFDHKIEKNYLPVPVTNLTISGKIDKLNETVVRFCWVGRLCDFKSYILVYTINKLIEIAVQTKRCFKYFIIGDGPFKNYIEKNIKSSPNVDVIFCGSIEHNKLDDFLIRNVDILTAMGTSALEGAKLRIPTILLDASYGKIRHDYQYRLLYETKEFDLGHEITPEDNIPNNNSLRDIVEQIINHYEIESEKTYMYYYNNHTIEKVTEKFLQSISFSKLTYDMIDRSLLKKDLFLMIYNKMRGINI